jgi:hypothetical protein
LFNSDPAPEAVPPTAPPAVPDKLPAAPSAPLSTPPDFPPKIGRIATGAGSAPGSETEGGSTCTSGAY